MDEGYWALFCATGEPIFYLLFRLVQEWEEEEARTAWHERSAELV